MFFKSFIQLTGYKIQKITIDRYLYGVYEMKIHFFHTIELNQFYLESRISDAVAMAVRFSVPIYVESSVVEKNYFNEEFE